jgi:methylmalonyl-CoA/ethylmalonyl-CoA epimerase
MSLGFKMHHIGIAVAQLDRAIAIHHAVFSHELARGPYYDPLQKVSVCFLKDAITGAGPEIELVAPDATDSPVASWLAKQIGAYHICYETDDIEAALAHARRQRCVVIGAPVSAVAFEGRRTAWFFTPTRQLTELVERAR